MLLYLFLHQKVLDSRSETINVENIALLRIYNWSLLDQMYQESKSLWMIWKWHWLSIKWRLLLHLFHHQNVLHFRSKVINVENLALWRGVCQWILDQMYKVSKYTPTLWIDFGWVSHEMYCVTSIFTKKYSIQDLKWSMSRALHCQEDIKKVLPTKCTCGVGLSGWFGNDIGWASSDVYCYTSSITKMYSISDQ
jgi:hypothetical protein